MSNTQKLNEVKDLPRLANRPLIIDTETTGLDKMKDKPFLVSISIDGDSWALTPAEIMPWLKDNMPKAEHCVFHNAKYDLHMLINAGLDPSVIKNSRIWCTKVNETLINDQHKFYSLDYLCNKKFGIKKKDTELLQWLANKCGGKPERKAQMKNISKAPIEMTAYYAIGDVEMTGRLYRDQIHEIDTQELNRVSDLEMNTLHVLLDMERRGVPIDMTQVEKSLAKFIKMKDKIGADIKNVAGFDVNTRSGKQLEQAFKTLGSNIKYNKSTKNPIFDKEELNNMGCDFSKMVLDERSYGTMISTFLSKFKDHVYEDGRIRCDFNQTKTDEYGVITGRLSASYPNLQQIPNPKRGGDKAAEVRGVFTAPDNSRWISSDWKQLEFRIFAHYSNDISLIREFQLNPEIDYHQLVANLTGLARDPFAKQLNLGLVFGMGQGLVAKKCNLPYTQSTKNGKVYLTAGNQAKDVFDMYHAKLPGVKKMLKAAEMTALTRGYVKTITGRRIRFHNKNLCYKAGGLVFQGTSADIMKMKLVELNNALKDSGTDLILPVHDEFNFIIHDDSDIKKTMDTIKGIVEDFPQLKIPIKSDIGFGKTWLEASK